MKTIADIITELKVRHSVKKDTDIAKLLDMSPQTLATNKMRNTIPYEKLIFYCKTHELDVYELLTGEKAERIEGESSIEQALSAESASVPLYNIEASGGDGAFVSEEAPIDVLSFRKEWLTSELGVNPDSLSLLFVSGESMEPTLRPGDMVMIVRQDGQTITDGVYIVRLEDALLVKRLQRLPGGVMEVSSDNPAYKPFSVKLRDESRDFAVIGRVVWTGRRF